MAILLKVKWVDKSDQPDPCQRIRHIGDDSRSFQWKHTHAQAIQAIEQGVFAYYVEKDDLVLKLEVELGPNGCKYLKTQADGNEPEFEPPAMSRIKDTCPFFSQGASFKNV